ncbi:MAG: hypothetical protein R2710_01705 [Acidimicrobiales bacterium]
MHATVRLDLNDVGSDLLADEFMRIAGSSAAYLPRQVALVSVARGQIRSTLVIDGAWLELAVEANEHDRSLVEGVDLPRDVVLAVLPEWPEDWPDIDVEGLQRRIYEGICYIAA